MERKGKKDKMKNDMKMRNFSHYTYESYLYKTKDAEGRLKRDLSPSLVFLYRANQIYPLNSQFLLYVFTNSSNCTFFTFWISSAATIPTMPNKQMVNIFQIRIVNLFK